MVMMRLDMVKLPTAGNYAALVWSYELQSMLQIVGSMMDIGFYTGTI